MNSVILHRSSISTADTDPKRDGSDKYSDLLTSEKKKFIKVSTDTNNLFLIVEASATGVEITVQPCILNFYSDAVNNSIPDENFGNLDGSELNGVYSWLPAIEIICSNQTKIPIANITPNSYVFIAVTAINTGSVNLYLENDKRESIIVY